MKEMWPLSNIDDYEVYVDSDLWESVKSGNESSKSKMRDYCDGLTLYFHIYRPSKNQINVSIDELIKYEIINSIKIFKDVR